MAKMNRRTDVYFAAIEDPISLASEMTNKITDWRTWAEGRGLLDLWRRKMANYYGISYNGNSSQTVTQGGAEGELSLIKVNDLHNLLQQQLVLVTAQRPAGIARAINSDTQSLKSAKIGSAISEYYLSEANFESTFVKACESAILNDEGFVELLWDKEAGDPIAVDPETGQPEMSGDAKLALHCPWNVARDTGCRVEDQKWYIVSYKVNKFDAAATYPRFSDRILACGGDDLPAIPANHIPDGSDEIWAHKLVHNRTPAVPRGRYALMIGGEIVLDTEMPFKDFPIDRIAASDVIDGVIGYSSSNDMLALEEVTDALHSIITTNQVTFGGQVIVGPEGANIKVSDLAKGVRYFELPPDMVDKLKALQLTKTAPEVFQYAQVLDGKKQSQTGNVTNTLGQQAIQGASGSAMALIQAQAIQFNSGIQRAYFRLLGSTMTKLIFVLAKYADTPRVARIVGKSKASGLKEFKYTGQDLNSISSIVFEMTNAISQSVGGRMAMAQDLIKANMIKSPKQYITVATTGSLDSMTDDDEADAMLILEENEYLSESKAVHAVITEMHADHIKSHMSVLSSVDAKNDPGVVTATLTHIQEHIDLWSNASVSNPGLLLATGQQPLMPVQPPVGAPVAPQGAGQMVGEGLPPVTQNAEGVKLPNLPTNPATGEPAQVPGAPA